MAISNHQRDAAIERNTLHDMRWYMATQSHYIGCLIPDQRKHRVYKTEKERIRMLREDDLVEVPLVFREPTLT